MTEKWPFNDYAEQPQELLWLYTHCCAIGMKHKSDSGKLEHDIALFTAELCALLEKAEEALERMCIVTTSGAEGGMLNMGSLEGRTTFYDLLRTEKVTATEALAAIKQWKEQT